ncbi:MAG: multiprotein bridging factor aMBF1 [Candidatus Marsarchaeota archaeon]|jgi:putative transcription factor|nr:multiprotein bridging factor aMBF1 [Candidatus Marsarchaeota archaeon]MCL5418872.1 multiprotein bridging factor aMBF1 [Candidatus Marsarchaeota archaeon]
MEECELCGRKIEHAYVIEVEGVELRVCSDCATGKHIISEPKEAKQQNQAQMRHAQKKSSDDYELVDGYGSMIRNAREAMKLPLKVLAEMLNEKETLLLRIEEQKTQPSVELVKKLEKALSIKLHSAEQTNAGASAQRGSASNEASIGEFLQK